ncbi:MAG TPA: family 16 glycosylhydrolase [Chryseosolibacter sp.]
MTPFLSHTMRGLCIAVSLILHSFFTNAQCPTVVWGDEFENTSLDLTKWSYQIGDGCQEGICGWGNNELQYYKESNVTVSNGQLHITAKKERVQAKSYTSGRIRTINKGEWTYGRFEARIKLPYGKGLWPAFWMLPTDEVYGGWPQSGEIDIMEFVAADPTRTLGNLHYGDPYPNNKYQGASFALNSGNFPDAFHNFAIEWEPGIIRWFVDDILFMTKTTQDLTPYNWPFDQRFHFLLNVAVGGNLGGAVDDTIFPKVMDVDYVRVYNGFKAYITGDRTVANQEAGVTYNIGNLVSGTAVTWTVPAGASVVSGQGSAQAVVNFGTTSGNVVATFNTACGTQQLTIPVYVEPAFNKEFSFENFDEPATVTLNTYTGTLAEVSNPSATGINTSALVGRYTRNSTQQYDVLVYNVTNITDGSLYSNKSKKFYMDVHTNAPAGTEILLQLETSTATSSNYPTGRHSRYVGTVTSPNQWQRIVFELLDKPDGSASNTGITKMILLFASNTFTGHTYYFDNLDSYTAGTSNAPPTVVITSPASNASFASGTVVNVTANAADSDGTVSTVEFFANGTLIGSDSSSPYATNWTIGTGSYTLTARATDNAGAATTSAGVSVSGTASAPTYVYVSSIVTGTVSAGGGSKSGTATITLRDNTGNPVSNATVTGTFSGSFSETKSGVTGTSGTVTLTTTAKLKGTLTVNFCVTSVTHSSLAYNASANTITCTGQAAAAAQMNDEPKLTAYPNPFSQSFELSIHLPKESKVSVGLYDASGTLVQTVEPQVYRAGAYTIRFNNLDSNSRFYFVKAVINDREYYIRQMNQN